ncbi:aa3-type cytochrome c oxidase subunit IV [Erythrobacter sp. 3-20A1M]|nr:aa3-type cytochrome c oxidase subunit IV [Erythrobacter sp. 3-20A1M]
MAANDMKSASATYSRFISVVKVAVPVIAILVLLLLIIIS